MSWNPFRRTASSDPHAGWWDDANRAGTAPSVEAIDRLHAALAPVAEADIREQQEEMIGGLRHLFALATRADLPVVESQHRVVGTDVCHLITPVTFGGSEAAPGKLFLTSRRLIIVTGGVTTRPWHATRRLERIGRSVFVGAGEALLEVRCNSYGDALVAHHIGSRLVAAARQG
ncbi:MAG TPA: hypothetical protein VMM93_06315 [Vicinamibacterales bacterium]|nr:hypothetical protein [Vicinamibacterales bacterium]